MALAFKVIKPGTDNIISLYLFNQGEPAETGECNKEGSETVRYGTLNGHPRIYRPISVFVL